MAARRKKSLKNPHEESEFLKGPIVANLAGDLALVWPHEFEEKGVPARGATILCRTKWWQEYRETCWVLAHVTKHVQCP